MPFNFKKNRINMSVAKYLSAMLICFSLAFIFTFCVFANEDVSATETVALEETTSPEETTEPTKKTVTVKTSTKTDVSTSASSTTASNKTSNKGKLGVPMLGGSENIVHKKASETEKNDLVSVTAKLMGGFVTSLKIFGFTLLFALPLGLLISFGSMSKFVPLRAVVRTFVWIIRGTPLMLQLFVFAYYNLFLPWLPPCTFDKRIYIAIIAFVINYACYFSEIYRAGIESMPKGQYEAAAVLGMTKGETFFKVVLFQVVKKIVPPIGNEIITLVKDTSLVRVIMVYELMWEAEKYLLRGLLWPIFYTGVFYLLFSGILTLLFGYIEKKMNYYRE